MYLKVDRHSVVYRRYVYSAPLSFICFLVFLLTSVPVANGQTDAASEEFFESKVRPVLAKNCYACHTRTAMSGLRVDSREALLTGGKRGPSIVPGDPAKSLIITAIQHADPTMKMPMGNKLPDADIAVITEWVRAGAFWPEVKEQRKDEDEFLITQDQRDFWSFRAINKPDIPTPKDKDWAGSAIDRFIRAKQEAEALKPAPLADRATLIRRATLDVTGLLPTADEVNAFVNDKSPDAYEKLVDRLLASRAYGERWARHWLDVMRYGEDDPRGLAPRLRGYMPYDNAYLYRDWVVKALNDDMPFDQFARAQIAADHMDVKLKARWLPALGALGNGVWTYDIAEVPVARADERHDRVDVVTRGFLGLTVACARCHDHKFDPISQKDYYAIGGVFNSSEYREYPMVPKKVVEEYSRKEAFIKDKENAMFEFTRAESKQLGFVLATRIADYLVAAWKAEADEKTDVATVANSEKLDYELLTRVVRFMQKEPKHYPYLKPWQAFLSKGGNEKDARRVAEAFQKELLAIVDEQKKLEEENELIFARSGLKKRRERPQKPNEFKTDDDFCPGCGLEYKTLSLEKMNLYTDVFTRDLDGGDEMNLSARKPGLLSFRGFGLERFMSDDRRAFLKERQAEIAKLRKELGNTYPYVHGMGDLEKPENLRLALRGNPKELSDEVPRRFLEVLVDGKPEKFQKGSGRMELADSIVNHPITTRVFVNRIWKWHFGTGLVETPSNFGFAGERPSNPELLEYLSWRFRETGGQLKPLQKEILMSRTYQLASTPVPESEAKDGANRYHWRFTPQRLSAEQIWDGLLQVSGNLETKLYGPSSKLNASMKRRALYGNVSRFQLDEYLQIFDFPNPNITAEQRFSSNVPAQQLFFLNSPFVANQAQTIADKVSAAHLKDEDRIVMAYRMIYQRQATAEEVKLGIGFLAAEREKVAEERRKQLLEPDKPKKPADEAPVEDRTQKSPKTRVEEMPSAGGLAKPAVAAYDVQTRAAAAGASDETEATPENESAKTDAASADATPGPGAEQEAEAAWELKIAPIKKDEERAAGQLTPWARYVRVLLSSNEFRYVN
jgi:cytochrome c553